MPDGSMEVTVIRVSSSKRKSCGQKNLKDQSNALQCAEDPSLFTAKGGILERGIVIRANQSPNSHTPGQEMEMGMGDRSQKISH